MIETLPPPIPDRAAPPLEVYASPDALLSPGTSNVIAGLRDQMDREAVLPLLLARLPEDVARTFALVYPRFEIYYGSATLALAAEPKVRDQLGRLARLGFYGVMQTLRERAPQRIGGEATRALLLGVHDVSRFLGAAAHAVATGEPVRPSRLVADLLSRLTSAYMLTLLAVTRAIDGSLDISPAPPVENLRLLAAWSRAYALQAYTVAREAGVLRSAPKPPGEWPAKEDVDLAERGLDDYRGVIAEHDTGHEPR